MNKQCLCFVAWSEPWQRLSSWCRSPTLPSSAQLSSTLGNSCPRFSLNSQSQLPPHFIRDRSRVPGPCNYGRSTKLSLVSWLGSWRWSQKRQQTWLCLFQRGRGAASAFLPGVTAVCVAIGCFLIDGMTCKQRTSRISLGHSYL